MLHMAHVSLPVASVTIRSPSTALWHYRGAQPSATLRRANANPLRVRSLPATTCGPQLDRRPQRTTTAVSGDGCTGGV